MAIIGYIWTVFEYIAPFVLVLSLVIFVHELGHFLAGRWCGVKVEAFSLGIGPQLFGFHDPKGTHWRLAAFPLGGYVKFHGHVNGTLDKAAGETARAEDPDVSYSNKTVCARAVIVAAGPIANFVLAIAIFTGIYYVNGRATLLPAIGTVDVGSSAAAAGFQPGDLVISIGETRIEDFEEMQRIVQSASDKKLEFTIDRGGKVIELAATPHRQDVSTAFGTTRISILGIQAADRPENWHTKHYGLVDSVRLAGSESWYIIVRTGAYLTGLLTGQESTDQLSGPIRIAEVSGAMAKIGLGALLNLAAVLSVSVGLLNLFPIPLLDGGHLVYYAAEAVRGKALNARAQQVGFNLGFSLVTALMAFVTWNDILRLTRQWMQWG